MLRTIKVTQEDIDAGKPCHCAYCPIGLALMREFNISMESEQIVQVGRNWLYVFPNRYAYKGGSILAKARTPNVAANFIVCFDTKRPVKPFEFTIDFKELES